MLDQKFLEKLESALIKEKKDLENTLSRFAKRDPKLKGDWDTRYPQFGQEIGIYRDEAQDEVEEYDNLVGEEHVLELRLKEVDAALVKMKAGQYGFCEIGQEKIELERLEANPAAKTCLKHVE
ncbi:MAG: hypothetical protein HYV52_01290 [Parcubacteria group bacterium]|nr:hypothetical protein [Parcubacteria group bacterium]